MAGFAPAKKKNYEWGYFGKLNKCNLEGICLIPSAGDGGLYTNDAKEHSSNRRVYCSPVLRLRFPSSQSIPGSGVPVVHAVPILELSPHPLTTGWDSLK